MPIFKLYGIQFYSEDLCYCLYQNEAIKLRSSYIQENGERQIIAHNNKLEIRFFFKKGHYLSPLVSLKNERFSRDLGEITSDLFQGCSEVRIGNEGKRVLVQGPPHFLPTEFQGLESFYSIEGKIKWLENSSCYDVSEQDIMVGCDQGYPYVAFLNEPDQEYRGFYRLSESPGIAYCISKKGNVIGGQIEEKGCLWLKEGQDYIYYPLENWYLVQAISPDGNLIVGLDQKGKFCMATLNLEALYESVVLSSSPSGIDYHLLCLVSLRPSNSFVSHTGNFIAYIHQGTAHIWYKQDGLWKYLEGNSLIHLNTETKIINAVGFDEEEKLCINIEVNGKKMRTSLYFPIREHNKIN